MISGICSLMVHYGTVFINYLGKGSLYLKYVLIPHFISFQLSRRKKGVCFLSNDVACTVNSVFSLTYWKELQFVENNYVIFFYNVPLSAALNSSSMCKLGFMKLCGCSLRYTVQQLQPVVFLCMYTLVWILAILVLEDRTYSKNEGLPCPLWVVPFVSWCSMQQAGNLETEEEGRQKAKRAPPFQPHISWN